MAHIQKEDSDNNEDDINSLSEVLDSENVISNTVIKSGNTDTFYIESLNNDSNDSDINSAPKSDESNIKSFPNNELVEGNSLIKKNKFEVTMQSLSGTVSQDSTSTKLNDALLLKADENVEKNSTNNKFNAETSCMEGNSLFDKLEASVQSLGDTEKLDSTGAKVNDASASKTYECTEKNCVTNELVEEANCIERNILIEKDKLETSFQDLSNIVSFESTSKNESVEIKMSNKEIISKSTEKAIEIRKRQDSDSWTDDSSSSSSSDSDILEEMHQNIIPKPTAIKSKGEIDLEDLPPIEDLQISVKERELVTIGTIHSIVGKQVVVHSEKDRKPLDLDSVLFLSHDKPLGRIFDVFGPVSEPMYVVRFNSPEDIKKQDITVNDVVYFTPKMSDITSFVFVDVLKLQKGSDASWKDDHEPPAEILDYSDDEQERMAKQKRRGKNRTRPRNERSISPKKSNDIKPDN